MPLSISKLVTEEAENEQTNNDVIDLMEYEETEAPLAEADKVVAIDSPAIDVLEKIKTNNIIENEEEQQSDGQHKIKRKKTDGKVTTNAPWKERIWELITTLWPIGFVAFGGPQAHTILLYELLVVQRNWLDEEQFMELFAIGQGLPGPSSTQLVVAIGISRAGFSGGLIAFVLFELPGAILLTIFGVLIKAFIDPNNPPWYLIGLPPAAISLVFKAFYTFAAKMDKLGTVLALFTCLAAILVNNDAHIRNQSSQWVFPTALAISGFVTWIDSKRAKPSSSYGSPTTGWDSKSDEMMKCIGIPLCVGVLIFGFWLGILVLIIVLKDVAGVNNMHLEIFGTMYRIGSIIFGGGQVVLPLLQDVVVPSWLTKDQFLQGLGLAQSMPGPLFNFSAYLGAVHDGVGGAVVAFCGLFGPGTILIFAAVPFWAKLRHNRNFKAILKGLNSSAIGLVGAACVILWESAINGAADAMVFSVSITLTVVFNIPAPLCVLAGGIVGAILHPDAANLGQVPYCTRQGFVDPVHNNTGPQR